MALRVQRMGELAVRISGMDTSNVSKAEWRKAIDDMGTQLQARAAASFASERTKGSTPLKANSAAWNDYKARKGYDSRRGHMTGNLQANLNSASRLFTISGIANGVCTLTMREDWLYGRVPYAEYYAERKVRTEGILSLAVAWVRDASYGLQDLERLAQQRAREKKARAGAAAQEAQPLVNIASANRAYGQIVRSGKYGALQRALAKANRLFGG